MPASRHITILVCLTVIAAFGLAPSATAQSGKQTKHVRLLTVGNSFTHNATRFLDDIAEAAGHKLTHQMLSIGGSTLERHADKALAFEADSDDPKAVYSNGNSLQEALQSEPWDFVTIQQVSIKSHDIDTYRPHASRLAEIIHRDAPKAQLLVHQTWAYRKDDSRFEGSDRSDGEPTTQAAMYRGLSDAYQTITAELNARRIPVGDAFWAADNDPKFGYRVSQDFDFALADYPALPDQTHSLHVGYRWDQRGPSRTLRMDGHHANLAGEYLGACVWFECLFGESAVGNDFIPKGLDKDYARFLQKTAHQAATQGGDVILSWAAPGSASHGSASRTAIAVGTAVAGGPPHRSVREGFPHTAPALSRA